MSNVLVKISILAISMLIGLPAHATYFNLFNADGSAGPAADFRTYATLQDMLMGTNHTGSFAPVGGLQAHLVGSGSDGTTYWNLFNADGSSGPAADFRTYATLEDMLMGTNPTGSFAPVGGLQAHLVGSGSDGTTYWNLFNADGSSGPAADFRTYATLEDMLMGTNPTGSFAPVGGLQAHLVGSGSDGTTYWNLFNADGSSGPAADFRTYATLEDMLMGTNPTGSFAPIGGLQAHLIGSGASLQSLVSVPEPGSLLLLVAGLACIFGTKRELPGKITVRSAIPIPAIW